MSSGSQTVADAMEFSVQSNREREWARASAWWTRVCRSCRLIGSFPTHPQRPTPQPWRPASTKGLQPLPLSQSTILPILDDGSTLPAESTIFPPAHCANFLPRFAKIPSVSLEFMALIHGLPRFLTGGQLIVRFIKIQHLSTTVAY